MSTMLKGLREVDLPGGEVLRFLNGPRQCLQSVRDNGTTWQIGVGEKTWKLAGTRKAEFTYEQWYAKKVQHYQNLPVWARNIRKLPSQSSLNKWAYDSVCKSVTGHTVEPDGTGPDGAPSWLIALGYI